MNVAAIGWRRLAGGAALIVLLALLVADVGKVIATGIRAIGYPYDLDYGEGIVWQQMINIAHGHGYAPLGTFPAIVYHYPPVYHLLVAGVAAITGADQLATGRAVSLVATFAGAALVSVLAMQATTGDRQSRMIGAAIAAAVFATSPAVLSWAALMRVDMVAIALTLAGLAATARALEGRSNTPVLAALLFVLAVYAKQTAIFAPLAAFVTMTVVRRDMAWRFAILCAAFGLIALAVLMVHTHGQFLRHVLSYNVNRLDLDRWHLVYHAMKHQAITLALAALVMIGMRRTLRRSLVRLLLVVYIAVRVATLPLALKSGSNENYLIDLFSAAAVFVGIGAAEVVAAIGRGRRWPGLLTTLLVLIGLPVQAARLGDAHQEIADTDRTRKAAALVALIRTTSKPVISDFMVLTLRAGRPVLYEPSIAAELAHSGLYNEPGMVALTRRGAFGFFVTYDDDHWFRERYNAPVRDAIAAAYPRLKHYGEMLVHLPAASPGPSSAPPVSAGPAASPPPAAPGSPPRG